MSEVSPNNPERDDLYKVLLDTPFDGIIIHVNGRVLEVNPELLRMTGYSYDEIMAVNALDLFAPQSRGLALDMIARDVTEPYTAQAMRKSGECFPIQVRGKTITFRGETARAVAVRDISEFQAVEHALRESEQRFHDFARSGSDWFWEMDSELRFTYISERFHVLTGGVCKEQIGYTRHEIATSEQLSKEPEKWARHLDDLQTHRPFTNFEYKFMRGTSEGIFISLDGVPIFDPDGKFLGYRGTGTDVTQRKRVEEKLAHSEHDFRTIINNMADMFYRTDKEGRIIAFSPVAVDIMGYSAEELLNMKMSDCYAFPEERQATLEKIVAGNGKPVMVEGTMRRKDGSTFIVSTHSFVRFDENGEMNGVEGIGRDITEYKKAEQRIIDAKMKAEEANMAKTRFLAAASHDLRQPLQAVNLYLAVLASKVVDEASNDVIQKIEGSVGALNNLLESLLDISRLEAGLVEAESERIVLGDVLTRLGDEFAQVCADKKLEFSVVPSKLEVETDPVLLENILRNLLANAIKYTPQGKILLGCRHRADRVSIEVWDTGVGIAQSHLPRIFAEFYQVDNQGRNRNHGLGLGLSIVDKMAKIIGGTIDVRSWEGRGSVFALDLKVITPRIEPTLVAKPEVVQGAEKSTIIVIDDEADILLGLTMFLQSQGHEVHALCCVECESCLATLKTIDTPPDIIVADYRLRNNQTGVQAIEMLRKTFEQEIPAMILTGDTAPERLTEVVSSGLPIMHKPIEAGALQTEIERMLKGLA